MYKELIDAALEARENAYVPYSGFKVGSAVLMEDDSIYSGCNIENASYGATNCAERTAIFNAVSHGHKKIKALAVVGDIHNFTYPCGICRQVMVEFAENREIPIIIIKNKEEYLVKTMEDILPGAFTKIDLDAEKEIKYV
ncbi:MAG TPA: cytidine deaminase [Clostridiaceae bacterium]|jgi:cytidine deaminase|nr:cytidine deaminase [Clostridiaceae bacterium]